MSIITTREQRRQLARDNAKWPVALKEIPRSEWPNPSGPQLRVLRSRDFLVQEYPAEGMALVRLSVNITAMDELRWKDGIPWEDLQRVKPNYGFCRTALRRARADKFATSRHRFFTKITPAGRNMRLVSYPVVGTPQNCYIFAVHKCLTC